MTIYYHHSKEKIGSDVGLVVYGAALVLTDGSNSVTGKISPSLTDTFRSRIHARMPWQSLVERT